jgi:hypothetical protein
MTALQPDSTNSRAGQQAAGADPLVAHAGRVVLEVAQSFVQFVLLDADKGMSPGSGADAVDVAAVEVVQADSEPLRPGSAPHRELA